MKIRNGFVSNSSSSSFLIFLGKIKPENVQKIEKMIKYQYDAKIIQPILLFSEQANVARDLNLRYYPDQKRLSISAPVNAGNEMVLTKIDPFDSVLAICRGNDEGDSEFWDEQLEELDYEKVSLSDEWFDKTLVKLATSKEMYLDSYFVVGAARNG